MKSYIVAVIAFTVLNVIPSPAVPYVKAAGASLESLEHMAAADRALAPHGNEYYCQHLGEYVLENKDGMWHWCADLMASKK